MDPRQQLADRYSRDARMAAAIGNHAEAARLRELMDALYEEMENDPPSDFNTTPQYSNLANAKLDRQRQEEARG